MSDTTSFEATFTLDCASDMTIGPLGDTIWIVERIDLDADATYLVSMGGNDIDIIDVELTLAKCEPCGTVRTFSGEFIGSEQFDVGRYSLELRAPAHFRGNVIVSVSRL